MKVIARLVSCVVAAGALGCVPVAAQPIPESRTVVEGSSTAVTLSAAIDAAWQRAIPATEAEGQRARAVAEQTASSALWAAPPSLELSHRTGQWQGDAGGRESEVGIAVPLWLPGQRLARSAAAQAEFQAAEVGAYAARLRVAGRVREAAWKLAALQADVELAGVEVRTLRSLAEDVDKRVSARELARVDSLAARAELLAAENAQIEARSRFEGAMAQWTALTGLMNVPDPVEPATRALEGLDDAQHPELRLARQKVDLARKRLEAVRLSNRSAPEVVARYRHDAPGHGAPSADSIEIALRLPFGTDDRNQPLLAAASSEFDIAQVAETRLREQLAADLDAARASLSAAEQQVETERARVSMLRERARLIVAAFRAGEISLPETLRVVGAAAQAAAGLARQQAAKGLARARLLQTLGLMP